PQTHAELRELSYLMDRGYLFSHSPSPILELDNFPPSNSSLSCLLPLPSQGVVPHRVLLLSWSAFCAKLVWAAVCCAVMSLSVLVCVVLYGTILGLGYDAVCVCLGVSSVCVCVFR